VGRRTSGQAYETPGRPGEAPGTSGRPTEGPGSTLDMGFLGSPTDFPGPPWTVWTAKELPGVSLGFPGFPDVPETSPGFPGPPGRPRGFPGPPWDVRMCQGGCSGLFEVSYAFPEVSQTGMTDRIPPVSEAAAVPAHQKHVLVSVLWVQTFVAVPPSVVHNGWFGVRETCVLVLFCSPQSRFGSSSTSRTLTDRILPASWRTGQMMRVKCQGA
jgi:hypothetical protein